MPSTVLRDIASVCHADAGALGNTDGHTDRSANGNAGGDVHSHSDAYGTTDADTDPDAESHTDAGSNAAEPWARRRGIVRIDGDDRIRRVDLASLPQLTVR